MWKLSLEALCVFMIMIMTFSLSRSRKQNQTYIETFDPIRISIINGLGDRLLDVIGGATIALHLNTTGFVFGWDTNCTWECYDRSLMDFGNMPIHFVTPGVTYPDSMLSMIQGGFHPYHMIKKFQHLNLVDLCHQYRLFAEQVKPTQKVKVCIPSNICHCYGVHLRRSDRLTNEDGSPHMTSHNELAKIVASTKEYISSLPKGSYFYVCSENRDAKNEFEKWIGAECNGLCLSANYQPGVSEAITDFFCLSMCREVIQCIKYSTFSMMAAMIGNTTIINLSPYNKTDYFRFWKPLLKIKCAPDPSDLQEHVIDLENLETIYTNELAQGRP